MILAAHYLHGALLRPLPPPPGLLVLAALVCAACRGCA
jgi:hypothetical protein